MDEDVNETQDNLINYKDTDQRMIKEKGKLIAVERKDEGKISFKHLMAYINFGLGIPGAFFIVFFGVAGGVLALVPSYALGFWGE